MAGGPAGLAHARRNLSFDFEHHVDDRPVIVARPEPKLPHVRALDGLRGVAVAVVVLYHLELGWVSGGFLGVSLFFTLSGFLITSVLLVEHDASDTIDFKAFWIRRFRRLLPAAWAGVALAVVFGVLAGEADQIRRLPGDVIGALAEVANWRFIAVSDTYTQSYQAPSPLLHYWSLAIEEQFYLVFPLVVAVLVKLKASMRAWTATVAVLLGLSVVVTFAVYDPANPSAVYFNTGSRVGEILAGVGLALVLRGWWNVRPRRRLGRHLAGDAPRAALVRTLLPVAAFVVAVVLWTTTTTLDQWLYRGGFFGVAALSCAMVAGAITDGPLARLVRARPLERLGIISYGVYVYHWPLFAWLTEERTGLSGAALVAVRLAVTWAVAELSYRYLEAPIRRGQVRFGLRLAWGPVALAGVLIAVAFSVSAQADDRAVEMANAASVAPLVTRPPVTTPAAPAAAKELPPLPPPKKVLFLGDSLVHQAMPFIEKTFAAQGTEVKAIGGPQQTMLTRQAAWLTELEQTLVEWKPDVVVLESCCGHYHEKDRFIEDGKPLAIDSQEQWDAWIRTADQLVTLSKQHAKAVLWTLVPPAKTNGFYGPLETRLLQSNDLVLDMAKRRPELGLLDWRVISGPSGEYVDDLPDADGNLVRVRAEDGFHFTGPGMVILARLTQESVDRAWQATRYDTPVAGATR